MKGKNWHIYFFVVAALASQHLYSCDSVLKNCEAETTKLFLTQAGMFDTNRAQEDLLYDIFYAVECNEPKTGLKLSNILILQDDYLGHYYKSRFLKKLNPNDVVATQYLKQSAELGYSRAMLELSEHYAALGQKEKSVYWLLKSAKNSNVFALEKVLDNEGILKFVDENDLKELIALYYIMGLSKSRWTSKRAVHFAEEYITKLSKSQILELFITGMRNQRAILSKEVLLVDLPPDQARYHSKSLE